MNLELFMQGVKIGLAVAIPIGPICLLCIKKSLSDTFAVGIALALGVATADMFYAILGGFGVSTIGAWLNHYKSIIELTGACFIMYLGFTTIKNRVPKEGVNVCTTGTLLQTYFSIIAITLTSPMTIALFAGIFAGLGSDIALDDYMNLAPLSAGVFVSTFAWFTALSGTIIFFRSWFNQRHLMWINTIAGILIFLLGIQRFYISILNYL